MGVTFVKRPRLESLPMIDPVILYSLGTHDINFEIWDEYQLFDMINAQLDAKFGPIVYPRPPSTITDKLLLNNGGKILLNDGTSDLLLNQTG